MKKSPFELIISEIDALQLRYTELFASENDIKSLQGVERCLEMKMKIMGFDGKNSPPTENETSTAEIILDLTKLSKQSLEEIINLTTKQK
ncbi:MAG: hypothetical protein RSD75_06425 [Mucinivorans sp.]